MRFTDGVNAGKKKLVEKYEFFMKKTKYLGYATEEVTLKITQNHSS